ncbi:hypothetical protein DFH06DRAFT_1127370 [Mycena polygramma]|nr:hypothetical protein DFH06DRAFT_1127370 [Mycena polygramma]
MLQLARSGHQPNVNGQQAAGMILVGEDASSGRVGNSRSLQASGRGREREREKLRQWQMIAVDERQIRNIKPKGDPWVEKLARSSGGGVGARSSQKTIGRTFRDACMMHQSVLDPDVFNFAACRAPTFIGDAATRPRLRLRISQRRVIAHSRRPNAAKLQCALVVPGRPCPDGVAILTTPYRDRDRVLERFWTLYGNSALTNASFTVCVGSVGVGAVASGGTEYGVRCESCEGRGARAYLTYVCVRELALLGVVDGLADAARATWSERWRDFGRVALWAGGVSLQEENVAGKKEGGKRVRCVHIAGVAEVRQGYTGKRKEKEEKMIEDLQCARAAYVACRWKRPGRRLDGEYEKGEAGKDSDSATPI